jgi:putative redox protein
MAEQSRATMSWESGLRFAARTGSGHSVTVDSPSSPESAGGGPMELFLVALAGCTAMDIVAILGKMREPLAGLTVDITGERADQHPRRYTAISIVYRARGEGLVREKVERAVELSHSTYCSAIASLRPDCRVTTSVEINEA